MKKIIIPLLMALTILSMPLGNVFAADKNLIGGKALNIGSNFNNTYTTITAPTNGNIDDYNNLGANGSVTDTIWYKFPVPVNVHGFKLYSSSITKISDFKLTFYDKNNTPLNQYYPPGDFSSISINEENVSYFKLENMKSEESVKLNEFELLGTETIQDTTPPGNVTNLTSSNITESGFNISWNKPTDTDYGSVKIYLDGVEKGNAIASQSFAFSGLSSDRNYSVKVTSVDTAGNESSGSTIQVKTLRTIQYDQVSNLSLNHDQSKASLSWTNPAANTDFTGIKIYRNGSLYKTLGPDASSFEDTDLVPGDYSYKVAATYSDGKESAGITKSMTIEPPPPEPAGEVAKLNIKTDYDRVDLSWVLPESETFKHVNIYRETLSQETSFLNKLVNGNTVYAAGDKIFETNGTYFNDLTVEQGTTYEYTLTTTSTEGVESEGITAKATTPGKPLIDLREAKVPFTAKDLVDSGNSLLWLVGPFVLLALVFLLVPKLRGLIVNSFRNNRKGAADQRETKAAKDLVEPKGRNIEKEQRIREAREREIKTAAMPRETAARDRAPKLSRAERVSRQPREGRAPRESARAPREPRAGRG
jgi:hypothetical protein